MSMGQLEQLFFQNQRFGFYFLKLIVSRMSENIERLEREAAERDQEISKLRETVISSSNASQLAKVG